YKKEDFYYKYFCIAFSILTGEAGGLAQELLEEHTRETGQEFPSEVKQQIFELSQGQPWLVNALANQIVAKILKTDYSKSRSQGI
ncbi:hypothetical protein JXJ21_25560, partial [candidate division KSB1 bacterium]|nr:hypothetical protein [candidate division KSB1 bacterium]